MRAARFSALAVAISVTSAMAAPAVADPAGAVSRNGVHTVTVADPQVACAAMRGATIPANKIGTPGMLRADATVTSAVHHAASDAVLTAGRQPVRNAGNSSAVVTPAKPAFCRLTGNIAPVTKGAQPIGFEVNLPTEWNGSSTQFGGGGFNGRLTDATGYISIDANAGDVLTPLMRGYMTVGTDSGHLITASPRYNSPDPVERAGATFDFALNAEMFGNFATDAYKKVHDVAEEIAKDYYGERPRKRLWVGGSEGGREGLLMAQRFPGDIDGVFVRVPVIGWTGLFGNFIATLQAVERNGKAGGFTTADINLLGRMSAHACDSRDGIADAVLSDYRGCQNKILKAVRTLKCTGAPQPGSCLTAAQLDVVDTVFTRLDLGFTLPSGLDHYPGFLFGGEPWSLATKVGDNPSLSYGDTGYPRYAEYGVGAAKFVFSRNPGLDVVNHFDRAEHRHRMAQVSAMMDTLNPDLSAFNRRGGKLIVLECTADYARSAAMGMEYYDSVVSTMGRATTGTFMRLYVSPGTDHGCGGTIDPATLDADGTTPYGVGTSAGTVNAVPRNVDWFSVLENWALKGRAPGVSVTATANHYAPPFQMLAAKPICAYPLYPRYTGGNAASANSYSCRR
ncbi:tannase/feruloyl esterase family alpha/beta hydrolase [Actinomadura rudentiformis]|uniref:Tannase/feruloyl esterase family alpha/beta hydrolase n=1 Tax=Actinomadura rudentiformis TaxID=359158 RepID=A0A6H9YQ36_9ACTN|nr:tannase/feruloyl esterase family alpha/beta hydrolase [Actinomadura rudentiformis]KAB2343626.1 tannase/feruloyl esterase family alpha/beta hydrolase [Actinomadura rudentiformis]